MLPRDNNNDDDPPPLLQDEGAEADHPAIDSAEGGDEDDGGKTIKVKSGCGDGESPPPLPVPPTPPSPVPPSSPVIFIKGLSILPPRQKYQHGDGADVGWECGVALPPLRPEEPVASLRGALGEVLGYAHLTRYRLVVERVGGGGGGNGNGNGNVNDHDNGSRSKEEEETKNQQRRQQDGRGRAIGSGGKKKNPRSQNQADARCWSPFTLGDALVTVPPSLRSLGASGGDVPRGMSTAANKAGWQLPKRDGEEKEKEKEGEDEQETEEEVELLLDEYGDLSIFLPLLFMKKNGEGGNSPPTATTITAVASSIGDVDADDGIKGNAGEADATAAGTANSMEGEVDGEEEMIVLDATQANVAIRVVLERYDAASMRDQVAKVRNMLGGNAPYIASLVGGDAGAGGGGGAGGGAEEEVGGTTNNDDGEEKKKTEDTETEEDDNVDAKTYGVVNALPSSFLPECDALFESALGGGDLTNFYYLVCGEDQTLHRLLEEKKNVAEAGSAGIDFWDEKTNKKITSSGDGCGRSKNRKKAKARPAVNATAVLDTRKRSIAEIERALHDLNEATRVHATVRMSGYHPPPPHRRVLGDLAYFEATFPDGSVAHLTGFSHGFYVNRSTSTRFDPTPAVRKGGGGGGGGSRGGGGDGANSSGVSGGGGDAFYSHSLLDCLLQKSTSLCTAWNIALTAARERSDLLVELSSSSSSSGGGGDVNDDFVLYDSLFRNVASSFPNNASGPAATAAGAGGMTTTSGMPMPATAPSTFVPRLDSLTVRPPWLVPLPSAKVGDMVGPRLSTWDHGKLHSWDMGRAEEELTSYYGMDVRGGGLRDWNEELQTAREMSVETFGERIERARLVHKVLSDFGDAALKGVKAILDGCIQPMNPNEPARSHVYLHNNIFFSRAIDTGLDTFKVIQGDAAAKKSASRDANNMGVLHRLDVPGLHTLATVLVEYLGMRIVCQSVVPGILHGEKSHSLLYGAVETLSELQCNDEMHKLLEASIGEGCMVATRKICSHPLTDERMDVIKKYRITPPLPEPANNPINEDKNHDIDDGKEKSIEVCGPMEMKGILGSDKRMYVLDCTRLTPRDANWVGESSGGTGRWEGGYSAKLQNLVPPTLDDDEWTVCVLRPELVASYAELKVSEFLAHSSGKGSNNPGKTSEEDKKEEPSADVEPSTATGASGEEKEWVNVPDGEKKDMADQTKKEDSALLLENVERTLRFNVNVFLPFTRSIEGIDKGSYETLKQDEEEARRMARHLWDVVIPNLSKDIRSSSVNGLQIPADGRSLTELMHQRGINCRYLGRLAELARKEELEDNIALEKAASNAADKQSTTPTRFRMPICWLELLECEMVARAAKHVLDSYMIERASAQPAQMIASFLSAIMSVGEESAGETEMRTIKAHSGSKSFFGQDEMSALTLFFGSDDEDKGGETVSSAFTGRVQIWCDIVREIGRRYRYALSLYNTKTSAKQDGKESRALFMPLLRRICQRSGIRLVARNYEVGKNCVCFGGRGLTATYPIAPTDVLDVLPLVKHAASVSGESFAPCSFNNYIGSSLHVLLPDAKTRYEVAHESFLTNRNDTLALDYALEASAMYQQVLDSPLHPQISKCLRLIAIAHYHKNERDLALASALKYLAVTISLHGFDSVEVLNAHLTLADILLGSGKPEGVRHVRAAHFLMEFMAGKNYAGISSQYYRMGSHYYDSGDLEGALRYYEAAASKRSEDRMFDCLIARHSAGILARLGRFKQSFDYEKKAYQLYATYLGDEHEATKVCSATMVRLMKLAVEQGRMSKIQEKERVEENAADAVADKIRADEEAEETKPIKKKKQNKKKGKK